jgi:hypothetical protein
MRIQAALMLLALGAMTAPCLLAHHSFAAEFDEKKPIKLRGTVTRVEFINPHSWFHIDVKNPDGTVVNWAIEGGSPNVLFRLGFTRDALPIGTEIVVDGYQAKDGTNRGVGKDLTFTDGRRLFLGGSAPGANGEGEKSEQGKK